MSRIWQDGDFDRQADGADRESDHYPSAEKGYRRGFNQAADWVIEAIRQGATLDQLDGWLDDVEAWRTFELQSPHAPPLPPGLRGER
jgi:hypothetical protein